jgi:hypothetical protein
MRAPFALPLTWFLLTTSIAACSHSNELPSPPEGCREFIDTWCNQNAQCVAASERAHYREDCTFGGGLSIDCTKTVQLGPMYSSCLEAIVRTSCASYVATRGLPLPSSCQGVLIHD